MIEGLIDELRRGDHRPTLLSYDSGHVDIAESRPGVTTLDVSPLMTATRRLMAAQRLPRRLGRFAQLMVIGADVFDGHYSPVFTSARYSLVNLAAKLGLSVRLVSFSFERSTPDYLAQLTANLDPRVRLIARDPISQARASVAFRRPVESGADLAFLLSPHTGSGDAIHRDIAWAQEMRRAGRVVAVLCPQHIADDSGGDGSRSVAVYLRLVTTLLKRSEYALLLVPHDTRGQLNDQVLVEKLAGELQSPLVRPVSPSGPRAVKQLVAHADFVLSARMHLGVAALGSCVPTRLLDYRGKIAGLCQLTGIADLGFHPSLLRDADGFAAMVKELEVRLSQEKDELRRRLPVIEERARRNLAG